MGMFSEIAREQQKKEVMKILYELKDKMEHNGDLAPYLLQAIDRIEKEID